MRKISDRPFSEATLNYVAEGLEAIALSESTSRTVENVFESPHQPKEEQPRQFLPVASLASKKSPALGKFSPSLATSTPNVVKGRLGLEATPSPLSLVLGSIYQKSKRLDEAEVDDKEETKAALPVVEKVSRRGGKGWRRRSSQVAGLPQPSPFGGLTPSRRATIMVNNSLNSQRLITSGNPSIV